MTGMFELFTGSDTCYRFRLTAPDGTVMALSRPFPDKASAVAGIAAVREYAGMGLVTEIAAPEDDSVHQSAAVQAFAGDGAQNRAAQEGSAGDGASGSPVRLPRFRRPSPAHFLGGRAVARNHQTVVRWRQSTGTGTTTAGLSQC
jgi:uncharacterized protein YegP (UPF0339 family)